MTDVVIIGAGASGLMVAGMLGEHNIDTIVLDKMDKVGKKIYATGNGKCNFTNLNVDENCYNSNKDKVMSIINGFNSKDVCNYFMRIGIPYMERDGYVYPYSRQASTVVMQLSRHAFASRSVSLNVNCNVKGIEKKDNSFCITYEEHIGKEFVRKKAESRYVVIATGGQSDKVLGSDGSGFYFAKKLGHNIIKVNPALVPLKCSEKLNEISGVRVIAKVSAICADTGEIISTNQGEIIFSDTMVSGIPIFQISSSVIKNMDAGKKIDILINFVPNMNDDVIENVIRINDGDNKLLGLVPDKLGLFISKRYKENELISVLKSFKLHITGNAGFDRSQVTQGGVDFLEINENTLESKLFNNLYMCGEVIDVDGICGGYNLLWAWSSGHLVASTILNKLL